MMEIELRSLVIAATGLAGTGVSWGINPKNTKNPSVSIHLIVEMGEYIYSGSNPLRNATVQIDIWANDVETALDLLAKLNAGLSDYRGDETTKIDNILHDRTRQLNDVSDTSNPIFRYSTDWQVFYSR